MQILHAKYNALVSNRFLPIRDGTLSLLKGGTNGYGFAAIQAKSVVKRIATQKPFGGFKKVWLVCIRGRLRIL
jgi:hypothetical protein